MDPVEYSTPLKRPLQVNFFEKTAILAKNLQFWVKNQHLHCKIIVFSGQKLCKHIFDECKLFLCTLLPFDLPLSRYSFDLKI